ncbi:MAG: zinc ribbon domain-containing protein [Lachnospiraceae bacterium]|nr:zinc ribbon domain-containing protein [Lachnospiraceae bacterium]
MKYCQKCGKEIMDEAVICIHCGCAVPGANAKTIAPDDAPDLVSAILGGLIPILGLIMYCIYKDTRPQKATSFIKGAGIGFAIGLVCVSMML